MKDMFADQCTCPHCGQAMPQGETSFDEFWRDVPHKIGKDPARKAWTKLSAGDRKAAHDGVAAFYRWFKREYDKASPLHPSTYLNNKRWLDEGAQPVQAVTEAQRLSGVAERIKSGKTFLCTQITDAQARACVQAGLVTVAQCNAVGLL